MSKIVYNKRSLGTSQTPIEIELPDKYKKYQQLDELSDLDMTAEGSIIEQYKGPSVEEIEEEMKRFREETQASIKQKRKEAEEETQKIIEKSKLEAFQLIQESKEKSKQELNRAKFEAEQLIERAKLDNERLVKEAEMRVTEIEHEAWKKGHDAGQDIGYREGQGEVRRLIDRLGTILGHSIDIREEIIRESEKQMVELILIIARKVIKDEIVERKEVVINNIREAMGRIKERDRIDIRVNFADLELTTSHKNEIIRMMESLKKVNIYEDTRVDRGGVLIETDVGTIDARISSQLTELEQAIRDAKPL